MISATVVALSLAFMLKLIPYNSASTKWRLQHCAEDEAILPKQLEMTHEKLNKALLCKNECFQPSHTLGARIRFRVHAYDPHNAWLFVSVKKIKVLESRIMPQLIRFAM